MNDTNAAPAEGMKPCSLRPPGQRPLFRRSGPGEPAWHRIGQGLLCVTDGTPRQYTMAGLVFAVSEDEDGRRSIVSYCFEGETEGLAILRPYTLTSAKTMAVKKKIVPWRRLSYEEMVTAVRRILPLAWVPTREELWAAYGLDAEKE